MKKLLIILACLSLILTASNSLIASGGGGGGGGGGDGSSKTDQPSFYGPGKSYPTKEAAEAAAEEETRQVDQSIKAKSWFVKGCFIGTASQDSLMAQSSTDTVKGTTDTVKDTTKVEPKEKQEKPEPTIIDKFKEKLEKIDPPPKNVPLAPRGDISHPNYLAQSSTDTPKGTTNTTNTTKEEPKKEKQEPSATDKLKHEIERAVPNVLKPDRENYVPGLPPRGAADDYNCVCAECNRKCGTGHEKWCSYNPKPKSKEAQRCLLAASPISPFITACIEKNQICVLNGTPCCEGLTCKGKFPNTYCKGYRAFREDWIDDEEYDRLAK
jgi:hypothetical protein